MRDYWTPLATVSESEFDEYLQIVEETAEERLSSLERPPESFYTDDDYGSIAGVERNMYRGLLENLDEFESKTDLFNYAEAQVSSESSLPGPLDFLMKPVDRIVEGHRDLVLQELFEEAKEELQAS